jgi:hypothetical protein
MKKNIILSAALSLICLCSLSAQDESATVNANVTRNFEKKFAGATNIKWSTHDLGVSLARFQMGEQIWLAYFAREGTLITSGRKIKSPDALPIKVKESLNRVQTRYESKFGSLDLGGIYEMISENGTEYFVPLENSQLSMMVAFSDGGGFDIRRKETHTTPIPRDKSVIAKKN